MTAVLSRWGNSLAVRIPADMIEKSNIREGDKMDIRVSRHGRIILETRKKEIDFAVLYEQITPENRYGEIGVGSEMGKESIVW